MSWKGFFLRAGILSDGSNVAIQTGNLTVQNEIISKGIVPSEVVTAGAATFTIAQLLTGFIRRDPTGTSRADLVPTAALMVAGIEGVFIGATFDFTIVNTCSVCDVITVTTATGVTLDGSMTIDGGNLRHFRVEFTGVASGAQAVTIRSLGAGIEGLIAAELNFLDGATAGTQVASKAVIADTNINTGVSKVTQLHIGASGSEIRQEAQLAAPTLATIDDTALFDVGSLYRAPDGKEYVYVQGIASTILGDWLQFTVTSTAGSTTTRAVANGKGPLGVAMGAIEAGKFGWVQVAGLNLAAGAISGGDAGAGNPVYLTATPGLLDDVFVDGDMVFGALWTVQEGELGGNPAALAGVWLAHPTTNDLDIVT